MAVAAKLGLLIVVPFVISWGPVSAVKTGIEPEATKLVRRAGIKLTTDNNSSDRWQDPAPEKMHVVVGSDSLLFDGHHHEANRKVAVATATYQEYSGICFLDGSPPNYPDELESSVGSGKSADEMKAICNADPNCNGFQMNGATWRGLMMGPVPTGGVGSSANKCFAKLAGATPAPISADVQECMNKLYCVASMRGSMTDAEFDDFKCKCILGIGVDDADEATCQDWIDCLQDSNSPIPAFQAQMLQVLYQLRFPYNQGQSHASLLQQSSLSDIDGCAHPNVINEENFECSCWDMLRDLCSPLEGNELYECIRLEMCKAPDADICHSWKVGADGVDGQCSPDEINPPTLLEIQDTQRAERAVLADIFQGRRQVPENISEIGPAAFEESLSAKDITCTTR